MGYTVSRGGGRIYYVYNPSTPGGKEYEVNLDKPDCCHHVRQHVQPCRHMVAVFHKLHMLGPNARTARATMTEFWPKWAFAQNYLNMYKDKTVRRPTITPGKFVGSAHDMLGPPVQPHRKAGRPRKLRRKRRSNTPQQVAMQFPTVRIAEYASVLEFM